MISSILTIAIPTYHNLRQLCDTLITCQRHTEVRAKYVVVNNGASVDRKGIRFEDQLRRAVQMLSPDLLQVIQAEGNIGWMGGINLAFERACDTPYFCMMNDDLIFPVDHGFWMRLLNPLTCTEVGAVGPASNYVSGCQNIWNHAVDFMAETTLLIGFLMVVKSALFAEIGGLDEELPGGDDLDLSILIRKAGKKLVANRYCYVHHIGCQTGERLFPGAWDSPDKIEMRTMCLIAKHGFRWWFDCANAKHRPFVPQGLRFIDAEKNTVKEWVEGLEKGLDLGCGADKVREDSIGVDLQAKGEEGTSGGRKGSLSVADLQADVSALPIANCSQDYLIARHIFEHLIDIDQALLEWYRVLRPGGVLVVACPNNDRTPSMALDSTHVHSWTRLPLCKVLERYGFHVEDSRDIDSASSFVIKAVRPEAL